MPAMPFALRHTLFAALLALGAPMALAEEAAKPAEPAMEPATEAAPAAEPAMPGTPVTPETVVAMVNGTPITVGRRWVAA